MINVSGKPETLRTAQAQGSLCAPAALIARVREKRVAKGDCLEVARVAGIQAAKRTADLIPLCHPLPLHATELHFELGEDRISIRAEVAVIGSTGVEMEALAAVAAAALTLYDMLKMYGQPEDLAIVDIHLSRKTGGKSQFFRRTAVARSALVIVLSDTVAAGRKPDTAGKAVQTLLAEAGFAAPEYCVLADEAEPLRRSVNAALDQGLDLIVTVGGTGISPRDITVDTLAPLIRTPLPGIMEAARHYGQRRTPYALMSRGIAGLAGPQGRSLLLTCPGSRQGASDTIDAVLPGLLHLFECRDAFQHPGGYA